MKRSELPPAIFMQGWLMTLASIHRHLTDDVLRTAMSGAVVIASTCPQFMLSEEQAVDLVGGQIIALSKRNPDPVIRAFAERCLNVLGKEEASSN